MTSESIGISIAGCAGEKELRKTASGPDPPMRIEWSENCVQQHDGWQVMFWDMPAVLQLLREQYPWFLDTFQSYKRRVQQGDKPDRFDFCMNLLAS